MLRYLALGDSYTIGEGVQSSMRWPNQLVSALHAEGIVVAEPHIIAATGWTTDELAAAVDAAEPLGVWDVVSLLIGVNNQYRGRSVDQYASEYRVLLERVIRLAGQRADRVMALSIPDWGATPFGHQSGRDLTQIARELDAFNAVARTLCQARGVAFVDITGISRDPLLSRCVDDGLHPSADTYAAWIRTVLPAARSLLRK